MLVFLRIDDLMAAFEAIGEIYRDIFRAVMGHHCIITISLRRIGICAFRIM